MPPVFITIIAPIETPIEILKFGSSKIFAYREFPESSLVMLPLIILGTIVPDAPEYLKDQLLLSESA